MTMADTFDRSTHQTELAHDIKKFAGEFYTRFRNNQLKENKALNLEQKVMADLKTAMLAKDEKQCAACGPSGSHHIGQNFRRRRRRDHRRDGTETPAKNS